MKPIPIYSEVIVMTEINVNLTALENKIGRLRTLREFCESIPTQSMSVEGSGESITELSNIDNEYEQIHSAIITLIDHSIGFFENIAASVEQADLTAAENFE